MLKCLVASRRQPGQENIGIFNTSLIEDIKN